MFLRHSVDPLGGGLRFPSALVYRCFYAVIISHILYKILLLDMLCLVVSLSTRRVKRLNLWFSAPLYLRTLWRYTNAVIIIIILLLIAAFLGGGHW